MHVAYVIAYISPKYGGPAINSLKLGKRIREQGILTSWWATKENGKDNFDIKNDDGINVFEISFPKRWYRSPKLAISLEKNIHNIDLLHLYQIWDYPIYAASRIAEKYNKPYIISTEGIFTEEWRYKTPKKYIYLQIIGKRILKKAACIHVVTEKEIINLRNIGIKTQAVMIPNGVDLKDVYNNLRNKIEEHFPVLKNRPVVAFLGRLSREKGIDLLISAWKIVTYYIPSAILVIAGEGKDKNYINKIKRLVKIKNLENNIVFTGFIDGLVKDSLLARADLYVQTSYTEGMSTSILEALSFGKACVITEGCNFREIKNINVGDIVGYKCEEIASSIIKYLNIDFKKRKEIEIRATDYIKENYSLERISREFIKLYKKVLNQ